METDLARIVRVLRREHLFHGLETAQLARVASFFEKIERDENTLVFSQGDKPDFFYIVLEGMVRATRKDRGREHLINVFGPGEYFGEMALLFRSLRSASVRAMGKVVLLRLAQDRFQVLLREYPQIRQNLSATAESRRLVRRMRFDWLGHDEIIYYIARKHVIFLAARLVGPAFLLFLSLALTALLAPSIASLNWFALLPPILIFLLGCGWGVWGWVDWSNDYFFITSQRVVWCEKILALYDSREEAPLDAVVAVDVTSSQLGRILDYGNVDVRTFTGRIIMRRMAQPNRFASFVEGHKKRVLEVSKERDEKEREDILQRALLKHSVLPEEEIQIATAPPKPEPKKPVKKEKTDFREWWRTFLKVRYEEGNVVTYRKHWYLLFKKVWLPLILLIGLTALDGFLLHSSLFIPVVLSVPFGLIVILWLGYHYVDWRNDIYRLTPEQIFDIEKKPLGRESKKSASLDAPDFRVEHTRQSFLNILLNFGDVTVSIGQTQFTFEGVYNPDQVHQDVVDHRDTFMRRKRQADEKRERDRMVEWLVTYHQQKEKLEEQENNPEV